MTEPTRRICCGSDPTPPASPWQHLRDEYDQKEHALVRAALEAAGWVLTRAAKTLGVRDTTLGRVLERHPRVAEVVAERRKTHILSRPAPEKVARTDVGSLAK